MLTTKYGAKLDLVPYKSGGESVAAVLGSQVDATSEASIVVLPYLKSGKLKALATTWTQRISAYPQLPTAMEQGFKDVQIAHWAGVHAPAGTPAAIMDKMAAAIDKAMKDPATVASLQGHGHRADRRHARLLRQVRRRGARAAGRRGQGHGHEGRVRMAARARAAALRALAEARRGVIVPGAFNALSARVIADARLRGDLHHRRRRHQHVRSGLPDQGFMGLAEIAEHTARIRDAVELPLIVDADTGFGNALNVRHTVRMLERAGADCIQFEDQVAPKRCGHFTGKEVISTEEAVGKIKAAVDARARPRPADHGAHRCVRHAWLRGRDRARRRSSARPAPTSCSSRP